MPFEEGNKLQNLSNALIVATGKFVGETTTVWLFLSFYMSVNSVLLLQLSRYQSWREEAGCNKNFLVCILRKSWLQVGRFIPNLRVIKDKTKKCRFKRKEANILFYLTVSNNASDFDLILTFILYYNFQ